MGLTYLSPLVLHGSTHSQSLKSLDILFQLYLQENAPTWPARLLISLNLTAKQKKGLIVAFLLFNKTESDDRKWRKNINIKILEIRFITHTNLCCLRLRRLILITRIASTARGVSKYVQAIEIIVWKLSDVMRDD